MRSVTSNISHHYISNRLQQIQPIKVDYPRVLRLSVTKFSLFTPTKTYGSKCLRIVKPATLS